MLLCTCDQRPLIRLSHMVSHYLTVDSCKSHTASAVAVLVGSFPTEQLLDSRPAQQEYSSYAVVFLQCSSSGDRPQHCF